LILFEKVSIFSQKTIQKILKKKYSPHIHFLLRASASSKNSYLKTPPSNLVITDDFQDLALTG